MTERLIDAVCPHCGRVGTTVRVVLHEDGYTKLSRRCTDCGGECIHTFDHDWLSVARNKKLQADNERLTNAVALVSERVRQLSEERDYAWGEVEKLRADLLTQQGCCDGAAAQDAHVRQEREEHRAEVEKLRAEIERLRADNERLTRERDNAREAVEFLLTKDLSQRFAIRYQTSAGCMCPAEANLHCQNSFCPRRSPPGVITCQGGKP